MLRKSTTWSTSVGGLGIVGWEWRVAQAISLSAEYRSSVSAAYSRSEREFQNSSVSVTQSTRTDITTSPSISFSSGVKIGVSLYF